MSLISRVPAPLLVLGSVVGIQAGQAFGKGLFDAISPMGVSGLRLSLAAVLLCALWRPRIPRSRRELALILLYGTTIAGMNLVFPAMEFLPVGVATSLVLLGPITLALVSSRRWPQLAWGGFAAIGMVLFVSPSGLGNISADAGSPIVGVLIALTAGTSMAGYLLMSRYAGTRDAGGTPLALALVWAALVTLPFGVAGSGIRLVDPDILVAAFGLAVLSAAIPYSLDLAALRRLPPRVVGVLESLEPAVGAMAGLMILGELLTAPQWFAIACVTAASAGSVWSARYRGSAVEVGVAGDRWDQHTVTNSGPCHEAR